MDVSNILTLTTTNFFCSFSSNIPTASSSYSQSRNFSKKLRPHSIPFLKTLSPDPSAVTTSASSRRNPSRRRRNTLREKLDQVRQIPPPLLENPNPSHAHNETENINPDLDSDNLSGNSPLWDKLENWVDQHYNGDSEFVVQGKKPFLADNLRHEPFNSIGFSVLCGLCVFGIVAKLFMGTFDRVELKREEGDMLRRKKLSRMEREKLEKGSVKVLQNVQGLPPMVSATRPQLDRNELMESIKHAEMSRESLVESDSSSHLSAKRRDFDGKVKEIREMARKVKELERQGCAENDKKADGNDLSSVLPVPMGQNDTIVSNARVEESKTRKNSSDQKNVEFSVDTKNKKMLSENRKDVKSSKSHVTNGDKVSRNVNSREMETVRFLKERPTGVDAENSAHGSNSNSQSLDAFKNAEVDQKEVENINLAEKDSNSISAGTSTSARNIPKIIKSVKEAWEYLAEKREISTDTLQSEQGMQLNWPETGVGPHDQKPDGKKTQTINENIRVVNDVSETKLHEVDRNNAKFPMKSDENEVLGENNVDLPHDIPTKESEKLFSVNVVERTSISDDCTSESFLGADAEITDPRNFKIENFDVVQRYIENQAGRDSDPHTFYTPNDKQGLESQGTLYDDSSSVASSTRNRPGMVDNEAYMSRKFHNFPNKGYHDSKARVRTFRDGIGVSNFTSNEPNAVNKGWEVMGENKMADPPDSTLSAVKSLEESSLKKVEFNGDSSPLFPVVPGISGGVEPVRADKSWVEENFQQFDPIIKKIGAGFKENFIVAKEKVQEQSAVTADISELGLLGQDEELEWMKDEKLREIVFQVRENELCGQDPFYLMDGPDQHAFFKGLELKAEKVNEKLLGLHEWVHSRIENLDYGTDGISLDDPLEKIVPRWKGPTIDKDLKFLDKFTQHQKENFAGNVGDSNIMKVQTRNGLHKSEELPSSNGISPYSVVNDKASNGTSGAKTLIECSDGSRRPGKKIGKEHWQHTKKWSRGFLEVYNAETDPEIKSIMKDMGKGLDRWITEKETQDVADLMTRIPNRKQRYIKKKMDRLKREVEMYGAQAVIGKYREYSDEKGEDYLWWLDLQFVLCIELYTIVDGVQKVGFYSLEMAADLELNPKQYHVIAFEDPGDSKNCCYLVQAHMDMLGSGRAFVVVRPPKDAFREARANGFNVTVIKKGEIRLNADQTLEEVEEEITEIGSKIYHDKIMQERAVDIRTLMKGVVLADKATKR